MAHWNSWFSHKKWWFSIAMLVYQRVTPFKGALKVKNCVQWGDFRSPKRCLQAAKDNPWAWKPLNPLLKKWIFHGIFPQIVILQLKHTVGFNLKFVLSPRRLLTRHVPQTMEDIDVLTAISPKLQFHQLFSETPRDLRGHSRGNWLRAGCTPGPFSVLRGFSAGRWALQGVGVRDTWPDFEGSVGAWNRWIGDFFRVDFDGELFHGFFRFWCWTFSCCSWKHILLHGKSMEIQPSFDEWHIDCRYYY